ncbi:MAG: hypothetical protein FWF33_00430 [Clostridiales bacterium]|nr:hypothetical protein [Clostridiales bacterium]
MKSKFRSVILYVGIAVFAVGLLLTFIFSDASGTMSSVAAVLCGIGAGWIGAGVAFMIRGRRLKDDPERAKRLEIEEKDERNIHIREKAGYIMWFISLIMIAALMLTFRILDDMLPFWLCMGVFWIHIICYFVLISVYKKKI